MLRLHASQVAQADGLLRVMQTLPPREVVVPPGQPPLLPPAQWGRPTLLLDLDQTLIRSCPVPEGQALPVRMCHGWSMHAPTHALWKARPLLYVDIDIVIMVERLCVRVDIRHHISKHLARCMSPAHACHSDIRHKLVPRSRLYSLGKRRTRMYDASAGMPVANCSRALLRHSCTHLCAQRYVQCTLTRMPLEPMRLHQPARLHALVMPQLRAGGARGVLHARRRAHGH